MAGNRSIKIEKLNDRHILLERISAGQHFWKSKWLVYFHNTEFLPVGNSEKTKWQAYFVKLIFAGQQFWKTNWSAYFNIVRKN